MAHELSATGQRKETKGKKLGKDWEELNTGDEFKKLANQERLAMFTTAFRAHDVDGSGVIDGTELLALVESMYPDTSTRVQQSYVNTLLREVDVDADGHLQYEEFIERAQTSDLIQRMFDNMERAKRLEKEFNEMDVDGSGEVDAGELTNLIAKAFPNTGEVMRAKYVKAILDQTDKDRSGTVTIDELFQSEYFFLLADADEEQVPETKQKKVPRTTKTKTSGVGGGMAARCSETSPRRKNREPLSKPGSPNSKKKVVVERLEVEDFKPLGLSGQELMDNAELELESHAGTNQWNDAKEYFEDAAEAYLREGNYDMAGEAYTRCAEVLGKSGRPLESANTLVKAAEAFRVCKPKEAVETLHEAIDVYEDHERFRMVARLYRIIAEIYENSGEFEHSIDNYIQSAEQYQAENDMSMKAQCVKKAAQLHAQRGEYHEAIELYEALAKMTLDNNMTGNPVFGRLEEFYFRALICHIAHADQSSGTDRLAGFEKAEKELKKYEDIDFETAQCREYELCRSLVGYARTLNTTQMHAQIEDFLDARKQLEPWLKDLLRLIAKQLDDWLERTGEGASK